MNSSPKGRPSGGRSDRTHAEHDVIKTADHILDLGPGGGVNGGEIVAEGTPEQVAAVERSFTGEYLRETLAKSPVRSEPATLAKPRARAKRASADQPDLIVAK